MITLLYHYKRDDGIKLDEAILIYEDGTTEKVAESELDSVAEKAKPSVSETKESWSTANQIYSLDGYAWGLNSELRSICLGTELEVKAAIKNPKLKTDNPEVDAVIEMERQVTKKESEQYGKRPEGDIKLRAQKPKRPSNKRIRLMHNARRQRYNLGQFKATKKLTLHRT